MSGPDPLAVLTALEEALNPANPAATPGLTVLAYGEVSACLQVPGLPGQVSKRMSGFRDANAAEDYERLVLRYLDELGAANIAAVPTTVIQVPRPGRVPVVYLMQPQLPADTLGHRRLIEGDDATVELLLVAVLERCHSLDRGNAARTDGVEVTVDAQLSNWALAPDRPHDPVLLDVGTPFMRQHGRHLIDLRWLETPIPAGIRTYYRRRRLVGAYLDDYFDPRTLAVDVLGNFHKEGRADRVRLGVEVVNAWLRESSTGMGPTQPVSVEEVAAYYAADAGQLELYLRLRRADRFVRTRILRRSYDFVLPGHVHR